MLTSVDKIFKSYATEEYGDIFSNEQIEEARVYAFQTISEKTKKYGRQENGSVQKCFLDYLSRFIKVTS